MTTIKGDATIAEYIGEDGIIDVKGFLQSALQYGREMGPPEEVRKDFEAMGLPAPHVSEQSEAAALAFVDALIARIGPVRSTTAAAEITRAGAMVAAAFDHAVMVSENEEKYMRRVLSRMLAEMQTVGSA